MTTQWSWTPNVIYEFSTRIFTEIILVIARKKKKVAARKEAKERKRRGNAKVCQLKIYTI